MTGTRYAICAAWVVAGWLGASAMAADPAPAPASLQAPTPGHPVTSGGAVYMAIPQSRGAQAGWQVPSGATGPIAVRGRPGGRGRGWNSRRAAQDNAPDPRLEGTKPPS